MQPTTDHPAVEVLLAFFAEMNAWETEVARHYKSIDWAHGDYDELQQANMSHRERLDQIFERFCELGKQAERLQERGWTCNLQLPEHSDETVTSVEEKPGTVIVETQQMRPNGGVFRYELVQMDGQWHVRDNRQRRSEVDASWSKYML